MTDESFEYLYNQNGDIELYIYSYDDIVGASLSVSIPTVETKYVRLPDNALKAGDFIEIKDGVVSSTLGKTYTKVEQVALYDSGILELDDYYIDEEDPAASEYYYQTVYRDSFLDIPEVEEELIEIDVKYYPSDSDEFIILKSHYMYYYNDKDEKDCYEVFINSKLVDGELETDNHDFQRIKMIAESPYYDGKEYAYGFEITTGASGDISGARIVIDGEKVVKTTVKLPGEAIDLVVDQEVIKESLNPVSGGAVYNATKELEYQIEELENQMPTLPTIENEPKSGSENLVTSGGVYNAIQAVNTRSSVYSWSNSYLSVVVTTSNKSTTTDARIYVHDNSEALVQDARNKMCNNTEVSVIFADEPDNVYHITPENISDISYMDGYYSFNFKFSFVGASSFPINTDVTRTIDKFIMRNKPKVGLNSYSTGYLTAATGAYSCAEGWGTVAMGDYSHVEGRFNIVDLQHKYVNIVGNGTIDNRSNAHTLDWAGNAWYAGSVEAKAIILSSSTKGSTKRFKITVDDSGTLSATEIVATEVTE